MYTFCICPASASLSLLSQPSRHGALTHQVMPLPSAFARLRPDFVLGQRARPSDLCDHCRTVAGDSTSVASAPHMLVLLRWPSSAGRPGCKGRQLCSVDWPSGGGLMMRRFRITSNGLQWRIFCAARKHLRYIGTPVNCVGSRTRYWRWRTSHAVWVTVWRVGWTVDRLHGPHII